MLRIAIQVQVPCSRRREKSAQEVVDPFTASLRRVQQGRADEEEFFAQEEAVGQHESVQRADKLLEVHISGLDYNASESHVLEVFRKFYRAALNGAQPRHGTLLAWDILKLSPEEGIQKVSLVRAKKKRFAAQIHGGHGFVVVHESSVAELLFKASENPELNCTPPGRSTRKCEGVSVQRKRGTKRSVDVTSTHYPLSVSRVQMTDQDPTEPLSFRKTPTCMTGMSISTL